MVAGNFSGLRSINYIFLISTWSLWSADLPDNRSQYFNPSIRKPSVMVVVPTWRWSRSAPRSWCVSQSECAPAVSCQRCDVSSGSSWQTSLPRRSSAAPEQTQSVLPLKPKAVSAAGNTSKNTGSHFKIWCYTGIIQTQEAGFEEMVMYRRGYIRGKCV